MFWFQNHWTEQALAININLNISTPLLWQLLPVVPNSKNELIGIYFIQQDILVVVLIKKFIFSSNIWTYFGYGYYNNPPPPCQEEREELDQHILFIVIIFTFWIRHRIRKITHYTTKDCCFCSMEESSWRYWSFICDRKLWDHQTRNHLWPTEQIYCWKKHGLFTCW